MENGEFFPSIKREFRLLVIIARQRIISLLYRMRDVWAPAVSYLVTLLVEMICRKGVFVLRLEWKKSKTHFFHKSFPPKYTFSTNHPLLTIDPTHRTVFPLSFTSVPTVRHVRNIKLTRPTQIVSLFLTKMLFKSNCFLKLVEVMST